MTDSALKDYNDNNNNSGGKSDEFTWNQRDTKSSVAASIPTVVGNEYIKEFDSKV